jgi:hypothetical protein
VGEDRVRIGDHETDESARGSPDPIRVATPQSSGHVAPTVSDAASVSQVPVDDPPTPRPG